MARSRTSRRDRIPREERARTTLRNVRSEGHSYVELREDNTKPIFFCILCMVRCYSEKVLQDHLHGRFHKKMYEHAKLTLLKENPWPFNDGMFFFHLRCDENDGLQNESTDKSGLDIGTPEGSESSRDLTSERSLGERVDSDGNGYDLVIPGVLLEDKVSDLGVRSIGVGKIAARAYETDGATKGISRIWCEWLGDGHADQEDIAPPHDFAIVLFAFNYDLGRERRFVDTLLPNTRPALEENKERKGKKRKSQSDPEDVTDSLSNQLEEFQASGGSCSRNLMEGSGDRPLQSRVMSRRRLRKELREQRRLATLRECDLCKHKLLPGRDVATLVNMKTGRLVCSSRNLMGKFHVCHISCLVYWVLFCEYEVYTKQPIAPEVKTRYKRKKGARGSEAEREVQKQIYSPFCTECQGTGIDIDGDELEEATAASVDELFKYKMEVCYGRRGYTKFPEMLENCSIGFYFPPQPEGTMIFSEYVSPLNLKMLHFYRAVE